MFKHKLNKIDVYSLYIHKKGFKMSRLKINDYMKKKEFSNVVNIRLTKEDRKKLDYIKECNNITMSDFIRFCIDSEYKFLIDNK